MIVTLPWPHKALTPNAKRRKHWRSYQPFIKADREAGHALTLAALPYGVRQRIKEMEGRLDLTVTFFPPDARLRDDDGMISAFKHLRDGMSDALGLDDHRFAVTYRFGEPMKPGRVEVCLG